MDPSFERGKRLVEGPTEVSELIRGGHLDLTRVEVTNDESFAFDPMEGIGEHLAQDTNKSVIEVLVAAPAVVR
jgi:hypothetical protein